MYRKTKQNKKKHIKRRQKMPSTSKTFLFSSDIAAERKCFRSLGLEVVQKIELLSSAFI